MKIAIIGRPNVGKSTIFNRLVGEKKAIVGNVSGITRDRKSTDAELFGVKFCLFDTPGIDPFSKEELAKSMNDQSFAAIKDSDIILFVIDALDGVTEYDKSIADWLRKSLKIIGNRRVLLIANKSETKRNYDSHNLGFGEGIKISAEHNLGFEDLYVYLSQCDVEINQNLDEDDDDKKHNMKIAIVGRPNVGKSTLINSILGENRLLTGHEAGITRDAISVNWVFKEKTFSIIDTAGQRKKSKLEDKVESVAVMDAWKYIRQANVVVVVMDIQNPLEKQDLTIARKVLDEGKVLIFALNKSDLVDDAEKVLISVKTRLKKEFAQLPGAACLLVSAKEKLGLIRIFQVALKLFDLWSSRVSTGVLNKWLASAIEQKHPPLINGIPINLKYISQTNTKPPTFILFANKAEKLPKHYERYLINNLRESFDLQGITLRLFLRKQGK